MKRTDLIALAERLETVSTLDGNASFEDLERAADFLRQIAEAKPVLWKAAALAFAIGQDVIDEMTDEQRVIYSIPLYTLPLED